MEKKVRTTRAGVRVVIILERASALLEFYILAYKKFYLHNCEISSYEIFAFFCHLQFSV